MKQTSARTSNRTQRRAGLMFVLPAFSVLLLFLAYPVFNSVYISLTRFDLVSAPQWVGLRNYIGLLQDTAFINTVQVTVSYLVGSLLFTLVAAFILALLLNNAFRGAGVYKAVIFTPVVISQIVTAVIWRFLLHRNSVFNYLLAEIGLFSVAPQWLNNPDLVLHGFRLLTVWKETGYFMVLFLAGLQTIPDVYYEVAGMDGAGLLRKVFAITMPLLKPTFYFAIIMGTIRILNLFAPFYMMTGGGPAKNSEVISLLIYKTGFEYLEMGKASAMSIFMILGAGVIVLSLRKLEQRTW